MYSVVMLLIRALQCFAQQRQAFGLLWLHKDVGILSRSCDYVAGIINRITHDETDPLKDPSTSSYVDSTPTASWSSIESLDSFVDWIPE